MQPGEIYKLNYPNDELPEIASNSMAAQKATKAKREMSSDHQSPKT
jgi:hypothetical protein